MGSLLHPVGSQPSGIYWARRGALVLAVVLVVAALVFVFRPQPSDPVAAVPAPESVTPAATQTESPSTSATPSASPTPTGPVACDASNSQLRLAGYQKVKQNAKQSFRLSLTNNSALPCVLDLKPATFTLAVVSGTDQIWTTEHCDTWVPSHKQSLKAGKAYEFAVTWPVTRSAAGCKTAKSVPGVGTYVANATFASDAKARQVFVVTKAG
jgi:hypothetical protein